MSKEIQQARPAKKSFVFYHDQIAAIKNLPPESFQSLVLAVGKYSESGVEPELDPVMSALFSMFKNTIDRDLEKYDKICNRNRINGLKKKKKRKPVGASGGQAKPDEAKKAESDTDSDTDSERDISKYSVEFESFWKAYPKKKGKGGAYKAWQKAKGKPELDVIIAKVESLKITDDWQKSGGQFIPHPQTWINDDGWFDEVESTTKPDYSAKMYDGLDI